MNPSERIIVALDVDSPYRAFELIREIRECQTFKVGHYLSTDPVFHLDLMERDFRNGFPEDVRENPKIFIDFKYLDIPDTVYAAVSRLTRLNHPNTSNISMCTVHADLATMKAAVQGANGLKILAVTLLTSVDDTALQYDYGWEGARAVYVCRKARTAVVAGCDGVICSPQEVKMIREIVPKDFLIVTPGIRDIETSVDSHARTGTARQAIQDGADYLVIGRPIVNARDPVEAFDRFVQEISLG